DPRRPGRRPREDGGRDDEPRQRARERDCADDNGALDDRERPARSRAGEDPRDRYPYAHPLIETLRRRVLPPPKEGVQSARCTHEEGPPARLEDRDDQPAAVSEREDRGRPDQGGG